MEVELEIVWGGANLVYMKSLSRKNIFLLYKHVMSQNQNTQKVKCPIYLLYTNDTFSLKWISTNFPKRLLLLLRTVFAFPNASKSGLANKDKIDKNVLIQQQEGKIIIQCTGK